jgi:dipeptidyl aminopeptidase/acylaminoacyl peptidase
MAAFGWVELCRKYGTTFVAIENPEKERRERNLMSNEKNKKMKSYAAAMMVMATLFVLTAPGQQTGGRPWTVEDSVATRYFYDWSSPGTFVYGSGQYVTASPDGRHFAIGTHRGDLSCDCTRYEMMIYSTDQVRAALQQGSKADGLAPLHTIRMGSTSGELAPWEGPGIRNVKWQDNRTLVFAGTGEVGSDDSVFRLDIKSGKLLRMTDPAHNIISEYGDKWDIRGDTIVYSTMSEQPRERDPAKRLSAGASDYPLRGNGSFYGLKAITDVGEYHPAGTFVATGGRRGRVLVQPALRVGGDFAPTLSPDGRLAAVSVGLEKGKPVPAAWKPYAGLGTPIPLMDDPTRFRLGRFVLFDTKNGKSKPIFDLPFGPITVPPGSFWSADGKRVVLVNVSLPLTEDVENRKKTGYIVDYEVATGKWSVLAPTTTPDGVVGVTSVDWLTEGKGLLIRRAEKGGKPAEGTVLELTDAGWRSKTVPASTAPPKAPTPELDGGLKVSIRETANDPPKAVATDGKNEVTLVGQDPALNGIRRARYQEVKWTERAGHVESGGLYLPPDDVQGRMKPYPLVIQHTGDGGSRDAGRFLPDGGDRTAFAAQALAARGFAVLNIHHRVSDSYFTEGRKSQTVDSARAIVERIDAAVAELTRQGLVDPKRVGLVGFSYTGYQAFYAATYAKKTIPAAAIVADSGIRSYSERTYLAARNNGQPNRATEGHDRNNGGSFWEEEGRRRWLENSPLFNVDKLETPVLFVYHGFSDAMATEIIGTFMANKKESDFILIPGGAHQLHRPKQRQASLQATVDWMSFWLLGKEIDPDKDEARQEQYYYWRQLRKQRDDRWAKNGNPWDKLRKRQDTAVTSAATKADDTSKATSKPDDQ